MRTLYIIALVLHLFDDKRIDTRPDTHRFISDTAGDSMI